ncbi:phage tail tube protein [Gorillibacterium timonense]|uniref:phage tail tube protein n=1 Tax=Gorillibacterium timonense TaxID=1689269 RepID=UPI00071C237F|nr:phage tail tube protein [Gorillibacterium timonense]
MAYLNAGDIISGKEGRAFAVINGVSEEMFFVKSLEAKIEKQKAEIKTIGSRRTQHKTTGWSGTGSMTIYYMTSKFRKLMQEYLETGRDTYFDIMVVNEDPSSSVGSQKIMLQNVNLNSVILAKLDVESDALEEETEFTFEGVAFVQHFNDPVIG